jgi:Zn-dependent M28 family amino/carboxypeptidase
MRRLSPPVFLVAVALVSPLAPAAAETTPDPESAKTIRALYSEALAHGQAYENLRTLVSKYPGRLSGSEVLDHAVAWAQETMAGVKPDRVFLQDVTVPHWERGAPESVYLLDASGVTTLSSCALGGSGATPEGGLLAEVVEVHSLDELTLLGRAKLEGKIVFFNRPMDPTLANPGPAYGGAGDQRVRGPAAAAKLGAAGALVRSLTHSDDDVPHTGVTIFPADVTRIPAAALSAVAADQLSAALAAAHHDGRSLRVGLKINARWLPDAPSHNVVGEIRGSAFPNEIIVVGGHLDSWDITPGAHDDGAGIVQSIEAVRLLQAVGIKPRHTLRCVAFVNEENGTAGGKAYARLAQANGEKHLLALETDAGGFQPNGFTIEGGNGEIAAHAARWLPLLKPYGIYEIRNGGGGSDVEPLASLGAAVGELQNGSQRYFDLHHTREDTIDKVNPRELHLGAAALAALIYLADTQGL